MLKLEQKEIIGIAALLIHAAKIDEIYSKKEREIILIPMHANISTHSNMIEELHGSPYGLPKPIDR